MEIITDPKSFQMKYFPQFSKPKLIGYYSIGAQRNYINDVSQMKYINKIPVGRVHLDLNHNATSVLKNTEGEEKHKFLLKHFKDHKETLDVFDQSDISLKDVPFMCSRGMLQEMGQLPYSNQKSFRFSACLFRGIIYVHYLTTIEAEAKKDNITEREKNFSTWGYQFEQYIVSDDPSRDPDIDCPVDENLEFWCVLERRLNQHHLFYRAEMDGVLMEQSSLREDFLSGSLSEEQVLAELRKLQFAELKTYRQIEEKRTADNFRRHKIRDWWLQCFLVGIETVICGFRDDEGIVKEVKTFNVQDFPKQSRGSWSPSVCLNFCDELLSYIKECFELEINNRFGSCGNNVRSLPLLELVFERMPRSPVKLGRPFPNEKIAVLDDWYINMFPKL